MVKSLLVVDVQTGFLNEFTHHIPKRIAHLIEQEKYNSVLFTRFINTDSSPYRQLLNWDGCDRPPETDLAADVKALANPDHVFTKPGLCGLPNDLIQYVDQHELRQIFVAGIDTDMCVLKIAMDLFDRGIEPLVLADCCASTAGLQAHLAGLAVLSRNIGAQRLINTGLGNGTLAAPTKS